MSRPQLGHILLLPLIGRGTRRRPLHIASLLHIVGSRSLRIVGSREGAASFAFFQCFVLESRECFLEVDWHVYVCLLILVIPLNDESDVFHYFLVHCHWNISRSNFLDGPHPRGSANADRSGLVFPESIDDRALMVSILRLFLKEFLCNDHHLR